MLEESLLAAKKNLDTPLQKMRNLVECKSCRNIYHGVCIDAHPSKIASKIVKAEDDGAIEEAFVNQEILECHFCENNEQKRANDACFVCMNIDDVDSNAKNAIVKVLNRSTSKRAHLVCCITSDHFRFEGKEKGYYHFKQVKAKKTFRNVSKSLKCYFCSLPAQYGGVTCKEAGCDATIHARCLMEETASTFKNFEDDVKEETAIRKGVINTYSGVWWLGHGFEHPKSNKLNEKKLLRTKKVEGFCRQHKPIWNHNCHCSQVSTL